MAGTEVDQGSVLVGTSKGPGLWLAPKGTSLPTDTAAQLAADWTTVGYISDDGVTVATDTGQEDLFVWQSTSPVRSVITERTITLEFTMVETTPETLSLYFDAAKPTATSGAFSLTLPEQPLGLQYAAVIDVQDGDNLLRFAFETTTLSEAGEIEITRSGLVGYPVTLKVLASAGNKVMVGKKAVVAP